MLAVETPQPTLFVEGETDVAAVRARLGGFFFLGVCAGCDTHKDVAKLNLFGSVEFCQSIGLVIIRNFLVANLCAGCKLLEWIR